ncbi:30S ribosomal protein S10, chloroplastic [Senna tora]|uniref:Small ribosomal subunit protein uS10c n=1 Tax=Senna tora TaxID=362788 RepID=A0A834TZ95_9FABA|nr:30S ribosomal protein S10, chloroplastic [Senna tora]
MAASSISAASLLPSLSSLNSKANFSFFYFHSGASFKLKASKPLHLSSTRVYAAPEVLDSPESLDSPPENLDDSEPTTLEVGDLGTPSTSSLGIGADADAMAPKQKIRIKLRSYWVPLIEDSCKQIMDAARSTNAKTMGPVPLPTKKRIYCVLKSPHVNKDARFHFEIRTHQRLIDILHPTAQTIDSLMQLDLPAGVDVEVKL